MFNSRMILPQLLAGADGARGDWPEVALLDEAGQRRATMAQNSEGEDAFLISIPVAACASGVGTTKRGFVRLNVRDAHGLIRSSLYANDDGSDTGFRAWDDPSTFAVRVFDEQSQVLWQAP